MQPEQYKIQLKSFDRVYRSNMQSKVKYWFFGLLGFLLFVLFLPWTQNIKSTGSVTTLSQQYRPQEINSPIAGKIIKWKVKGLISKW